MNSKELDEDRDGLIDKILYYLENGDTIQLFDTNHNGVFELKE